MSGEKSFDELMQEFIAAGEGGGDGGEGGGDGGEGGGNNTPPPAPETVESLKARVAELEAQLADRDAQADMLLEASVSGMSDAQKTSMEKMWGALKAENPLQKLVTVNTVNARAARTGADNARSGPSTQPPRAKNKKEFHDSLGKILKNQK